MNCPRCGQVGVDGWPACPRCGVVFAKLKPATPRLSPRVTAPPASGGSSRWALVLPAVGLLVVLAGAVIWLRVAPSEPRPTPAPFVLGPTGRVGDAPVARPAPPTATVAPPAPPALPTTDPSQDLRVASDAVSEADRLSAEALAKQLQQGQPVSPSDVQTAEGLYARHPTERGAHNLLEAVSVAAATQARANRDLVTAAVYLRRAGGFLPDSRLLRSFLLTVLLEANDWPAAEAAARDLLLLAPDEPEGVRGLAYALVRQDRSREAIDVLTAALERREDPATRALLAQIQGSLRSENGMAQQRLAYFNVRYDGQAHEDVGREIVRALEHHRATLIRTFDNEPASTIPVILFTQQGYYDATGAPAWAGGHYDNFDGRIRVPIGGVTTTLTPEMESTLLHELTHAFVADLSRGIAPRDLHEGLAQFMEGKRLGSMLNRQQMTGLADGRVGGVTGFYLGALSFTEFLMAERGQGGINDLLKAMAESGNVDAAFQKVYGRSYNATRSEWASRFRREHGS
jgi:hypothetical protein